MAERTPLDFPLPSRTKQHFKNETNINQIMARYRQTGLLPPGSRKAAQYGDFTGPESYLEAVAIIQQAQEQFDMLPSKARNAYQGDPSQLLYDVAAAPTNADTKRKLQELGILKGETPAPPPADKPKDEPK